MKYRIIKDGLGGYVTEFRSLLFWFNLMEYPKSYRTIESADEAINQHIWYRKSKGEVVKEYEF